MYSVVVKEFLLVLLLTVVRALGMWHNPTWEFAGPKGMEMPNFGELLRRLRGDRPQREIAEDLRMPVTTLSTLENQETAPRGPVVRKLASYYGVSVSYFYSTASTEMKSSAAASAWLKKVRTRSDVKDGVIATYAAPDY